MDCKALVSHAALIGAQLVFAVNLIFVRAAFRSAPNASPLVFATGRGVIALATLSAIHAKHTWWPRRTHLRSDEQGAPLGIAVDAFDAFTFRDKVICYGIGFCGVTLNLIGVAYGIKLTDAITSGAFQCAIPPMSFVIAYLFGESLTLLQVLSLVLAACGNGIMAQLWLLGDKDHAAGRSTYYWGCLLLTVNVTAYSTFLVLQKSFVSRMPKMEFLFRVNVSGVLGMLLIASLEFGAVVDQIRSGALTLGCWASIGFAGAVTSVVPYYLIAVGVSMAGPALAALYFVLQPVLVSMLSIVFLDEGLDGIQWVGMGMILAGLLAGAVPRRKQEPSLGQISQQQHPVPTSSPTMQRSTEGVASPSCSSPCAESPRSVYAVEELQCFEVVT